MNEVTKDSVRSGSGGPLAGLDYDTSGLALTDICRSIAEVVRVGPSHPRRVRVALGAASVEVEWEEGETPPGPRATAAPPREEDEEALDGFRECAPLVGTFYAAPSPGSPPFVQVGDHVEAGQQLGIIEAMKLMNSLEATRPGRIVEVLVQDGEPVEYGQPLVLLDPEAFTGTDKED